MLSFTFCPLKLCEMIDFDLCIFLPTVFNQMDQIDTIAFFQKTSPCSLSMPNEDRMLGFLLGLGESLVHRP